MRVAAQTEGGVTPTRAVLLPGTGSDASFVARAFSGPLTAAGIELIAVEPDPLGVVVSYLCALEEEARKPGEILVGGISLGAAVASRWALQHQHRLAGLLVALPAWIGAPGQAPASASAKFSAQQLRHRGLTVVLQDIRASTPAWLSAELTRAWGGQWPDLPSALDEAAAQPSPTQDELTTLHVPTGVAAAVDDAIHPLTVAQHWVDASPSARLATVHLDEIGADPTVLGAACLRAWSEARGEHAAAEAAS